MGFRIVHPDQLQVRDMPIEPAEVIYTGSIVSGSVDAAVTPLEGVCPISAAAGASNTTYKPIPYGICIGNNNVSGNVVSNTTYKTEYITQVAAGSVYGSTTQYQGVEGPWAKGDPQAMAKVALISPETIIRGDIFNAAVGTAPTVVTVTTGCGGDGIGMTTGAADATVIARFGTIYMRTGANRGIYRTTTSNSSTVHTWTKAMPNTIAVDDTAVVINGLRPYGIAYAQFDSESLYIDCSAALSSDYYIIDVIRLDLSTPGDEYVEFRFNMDNFCCIRA